MNRASIAISCAALVCLTGCGGDPLDYQTAMDLLRDRTSDTLRISFGASPQLDTAQPDITEAYQRLITDHVIQCKRSQDVGTVCEPGPAGDALTQDGVSELSFVPGRWLPDSIVALRRTGRNAAVADVRMTFQPSGLFHDYETVFNQIQSAGRAMEFDASRKQGKLDHVTFQRYAEGWHVESVEYEAIWDSHRFRRRRGTTAYLFCKRNRQLTQIAGCLTEETGGRNRRPDGRSNRSA